MGAEGGRVCESGGAGFREEVVFERRWGEVIESLQAPRGRAILGRKGEQGAGQRRGLWRDGGTGPVRGDGHLEDGGRQRRPPLLKPRWGNAGGFEGGRRDLTFACSSGSSGRTLGVPGLEQASLCRPHPTGTPVQGPGKCALLLNRLQPCSAPRGMAARAPLATGPMAADGRHARRGEEPGAGETARGGQIPGVLRGKPTRCVEGLDTGV